MGKLFIYAPNIHQGGGKTLLKALLENCSNKSDVILFCDNRMEVPKHILNVIKVKPSLYCRAFAEAKLSQLVNKEDITLCFGNLPPLFKLSGSTFVFIQNRYLIEGVCLNDFSLKIRIRLSIERIWLNKKKNNVDEFIVQTLTMKRLLLRMLDAMTPIHVMPFFPDIERGSSEASIRPVRGENAFDFVYVASGEPHKNHIKLLEAWCLLAEEGLFPLLGLTLNEARFAKLYSDIEIMRQQYGLRVTNLGELSYDDTLKLYRNANALIYPSTFESFGLPLIEAQHEGLPVLAPELDYVRDVLVPVQTFDPNSPMSIARAVKRYLGIPEPEMKILDATNFLEQLVNTRN